MLNAVLSRTAATLSIYIICFSVAAFNHTRDFVEYGWRPYGWAPTALEAFWTSLITFDLAVVVLLLAGRRKLGLSLAAMVMTVDVAANSYALFGLEVTDLMVPLLLQIAFLGFVLGSIGFLWPAQNGGEMDATARR